MKEQSPKLSTSILQEKTLMDDLSELVSDLTQITVKQAEVIDRLMQIVLQYVTLAELEEELEELKRIKGISQKWKD